MSFVVLLELRLTDPQTGRNWIKLQPIRAAKRATCDFSNLDQEHSCQSSNQTHPILVKIGVIGPTQTRSSGTLSEWEGAGPTHQSE